MEQAAILYANTSQISNHTHSVSILTGYTGYTSCVGHTGYTSSDITLRTACYSGHKENVYLAIGNNAKDWDGVLCSACLTGHTDIVLVMIEKGARDWDNGLLNACRGGHKDLVIFMLKIGATQIDRGLREACYRGHRELGFWLIANGANYTHYDEPTLEDVLYLMKTCKQDFSKWQEDVDICKRIQACICKQLSILYYPRFE